MKLFELFPGTDDSSSIDDASKDAIATNATFKDRSVVKKPACGSNIDKAKKIIAQSKMRVKDTQAETDDTSHKYNLGGHGSAFLFR